MKIEQSIPAIDQLVGTPWVYPAAWPRLDREAGMDCVTCCAEVYRLIGVGLGDPDAWRFPLPESWAADHFDLAVLLDWYRHWTPSSGGGFGCVVIMQDGHIGIEIDRSRVIHCRVRQGVVIQRRTILLPAITGYFRLRPGGPGPADPAAEAILRRQIRGAVESGHARGAA